MKTHLSTRSGRRGLTFMTIIVTMVVMGVMLGAYLKLVGVQNRLTGRSQTWNRSIPVVEAGIEEAMALLNMHGMPGPSGIVNVADLSRATEGWDNGGSATGPWYKWGRVDRDWYCVAIDQWDGTTTNFPVVSAASYVKHGNTYARHYSGGPMLAAVQFPTYPTVRYGDENDDIYDSQFTRRLVSCGLTNNPMFTKALVAKYGIDLNGNNIFTDSYDSRNTSFSTDGRWTFAQHRDHGDIASNDTVTNAVNVGQANIWGHVATGPRGTVAIGSQGKVGDANYQATGAAGTIQPGFSTDDMNVEFPDVKLPVTTWSPMPVTGGIVGGVLYDVIISSSGDYIKSLGVISGKILINAPNVRLQVTSGWKFAGVNDSMTIATNANITIYLNCVSATIQGNGIINSQGRPDQCYIFGLPILTSLTLGGNGEITSAVYAPNAAVTLDGGGRDDNDFSGAITAKSFRFVGHYSVHYDEALGRLGLWRGFTITSWNEN